MKRLVAPLLSALILAAGCSGGSTVPGQPGAAAPGGTLAAYQVPVISDPAVQSAARTVRVPQNGYGGVPGQALLIDATSFPAGSQANFAIAGVSAVADGTTYEIVSFSPAAVVNVLNYQTAALLLGANTIPAIAYSGVQYTIDPSRSSVVVGGHTYPMVFGTYENGTFEPFPSGLVTLFFSDPVNAATTPPNFLVDFNVANWVVVSGGNADVDASGSGTILAESAAIEGTIVNDAGRPVSGAVVSAYGPDGVVANSAPSASNGTFVIHAISGASYSLVVWNTFAPNSPVILHTASGNDPLGWSIGGPFVSVPAGYAVNVGTIKD